MAVVHHFLTHPPAIFSSGAIFLFSRSCRRKFSAFSHAAFDWKSICTTGTECIDGNIMSNNTYMTQLLQKLTAETLGIHGLPEDAVRALAAHGSAVRKRRWIIPIA